MNREELEIEQKLLNILLSEDMNDVRIENIKNVFVLQQSSKVPTKEIKYRVGRKEKRAILEIATGHEYIVFPQSNTEHCQVFCDFLNGLSLPESKKPLTLSAINEIIESYSESLFDEDGQPVDKAILCEQFESLAEEIHSEMTSRKVESKTEWINVEEKKPKFHQDVLVYSTKYNTISKATYFIDEFRNAESTTHWMPLPSTPEAKTKQ